MTKEIELTQGYKTTVDDIDFEYLRQFKWHYAFGYARRRGPNHTIVSMHTLVLERKTGRSLTNGQKVDHKDTNELNNTRDNLRAATNQQNLRNRRKQAAESSSRFKGVYWNKTASKWQAQIVIDGELLYIGIFDKEELAAKAYDQHALLWFREFARLNFPDECRIYQFS